MNEKLAPESNNINASNESMDMVPITISLWEAALADGKAYPQEYQSKRKAQNTQSLKESK
jgi:hypothetical protein